MSVVSFNGFIPLARYDGVPWIAALIQEAADPAGPWTTLETVALTPVDADPSEPMPRNLTTDEATLTNGWYRLVFQDGVGGDDLPTVPLQNIPETRPEFYPDLQTVGAMIRARTVDTNGHEIGTFSSATRPTAVQAQEMIDTAALDLALLVGNDIPDAYVAEAKRLVAIRSAMLIELSYYPEQVNSNRSAYEQYRDLWLEAVGTPANPGAFVLAVREAAAGDEGDPGGVGMPKFNFPDNVLIGWGTRW